MIRDLSPNEYYSSRRSSDPTQYRGVRRTSLPQHPGLRTQAPQRGTYGVHRQQTHGAMLCLLMPLTTPTTPAGSWNAGDREQALAQNEQDADDPVFTTDNVYIEDEHIDASPPYFTREALATPRARTGLHSPSYSHTDPFATLRRNYIPFPTARRDESRQSHLDSGLTSPTPVTAPMSPIGSNNNKEPTPTFHRSAPRS